MVLHWKRSNRRISMFDCPEFSIAQGFLLLAIKHDCFPILHLRLTNRMNGHIRPRNDNRAASAKINKCVYPCMIVNAIGNQFGLRASIIISKATSIFIKAVK